MFSLINIKLSENKSFKLNSLSLHDELRLYSHPDPLLNQRESHYIYILSMSLELNFLMH